MSDESSSGGSGAAAGGPPRLTEIQHKVLEALARPCLEEGRLTYPATNQQIGAEVFLSVDAVKAHLRVLYRKFGIEELPHNQKRSRLVEIVLADHVLDLPTVEPGSDERRVIDPSGREGPGSGGRAGGAPPGPRRRLPIIAGTGVVVGAALIAVLLLLTGGKERTTHPSRTDYVAAVRDFCRSAVRSLPALKGQDRSARAAAYAKVFGAVADKFDALEAPGGGIDDATLLSAVDDAASLNDEIAAKSFDPASSEGQSTTAHLVLAAGNIGAVTADSNPPLGPACQSFGDLVNASATSSQTSP